MKSQKQITNYITKLSVPELLTISHREVSKLSTPISTIPSFLNNNETKIDYGKKINFLKQGTSIVSPSQKLLTSTTTKIKRQRKKVTNNNCNVNNNCSSYDSFSQIVHPNFPSYCQYLQHS